MPENLQAIDYPDVLGTITGGARLTVDILQCAFAVYPHATAIGQPFEALILLQNMCDKPVPVLINIQLPRKDVLGNRISLIIPKDEIPLTLSAGEVGLLHVPMVPHLPTQPSDNNVIGIQFQVRPPKNYKLVRQLDGGRAAMALNMSPFRLNIFREVGFTARISDANMNILSDTFNIIPGLVEQVPPTPIRYEILWSAKDLPKEQVNAAKLEIDAAKFATNLSRVQIFDPLVAVTEQRFGKMGLNLYPGEALFIAKALTYVMEDGLELEAGFELKQGKWFKRLTSIVNDPYMTEDEDRLVAFLYTSIIHDAVRVGLTILERVSTMNFGTPQEHSAYADEVVSALEGGHPMDLSYAYLPLILAGLRLNELVKGPKENLWTGLSRLRDSWNLRQREVGSAYEAIGDMLEEFIRQGERQLQQARVPRPTT